jgi:hypothetical protein
MNGATMIPDNVLIQVYAHLQNHCCFFDNDGERGIAAQWERPANGACPDTNDDIPPPSFETVLEERNANPYRFLVATFSLGACQIPVLFAQYHSSRPEMFPRNLSLALALSEHGIVIDPCQKGLWTRYPSPLNLMLAGRMSRGFSTEANQRNQKRMQISGGLIG